MIDEFDDLFDSESEQELQESDSDAESESPLPKRQPAPKLIAALTQKVKR